MRFIILCIFSFVLCGLKSQNNYTQYVDPMIGTGGHGHTFPGATMPFAMVQLSPDTRIDGSWDGCSGYHYSDTFIYGFSHTHLSGTGCSDYGDISFMPTFVSKPVEPIDNLELLYYNFSHKNEISKAGYYSVLLNNGIKVELTSTSRVGLQQYVYTRSGYAWITLNLQHRDELLEGKITQISKHSFSGLRRSKAWAENQLVYYYFEVNRDANQIIISKNEKGETKVNLGYQVKAGDKILVKTALSSVDEAGAKANMDAELPHWDFGKVKADANTAWNTELNRIKAYGGTKDERINFYTALYHCMIHPNIMNDVDGRYMGRDRIVHKTEGFDYYTVFSLWDTYRALHPLLNIIDKKRSRDFIMTFKAQFEQSGRMPMWELWGNETNCMIGFHSVSVILDAFNKNVISVEELKDIYPAVKVEAMSSRFGLDKFREKGYLSIEDESESVSKTLEYSYDFYCCQKISESLYYGLKYDKKLKQPADSLKLILVSLEDDMKIFEVYSNAWRNIYNTKTGFMTPRKNGGWLVPFDPAQVNNHYTEANGWQYSFSVPQQYWLIKDDQKLTKLFNASSKTTGREQADITGLIGQYAHGNEPSHHIPYLFDNIDSTAKYLKKICRDLYKPKPDGLCGNEDCGQMSAWYVFSAIGFYPVNPTSGKYTFGNMLFDSVRFTNGAISTIIHRKKAVPTDKNEFEEYFKTRGFLFWPGQREIYFGYQQQYVSNVKDAVIYLSSPVIISGKQIFGKDAEVTIMDNQIKTIYYDGDPGRKKGRIYYTLDGTEPTIQSIKYNDPGKIVISENTNLKAKYISDSGYVSPASVAYFYKKPNNYTIKLNCTYNKQYTADGDEGLLDGLKGEADWRKGRWQGYQGQDFDGIIDLQQLKTINNIRVGCLQDTRSWILFPTKVTFYGSIDGVNFEALGFIVNNVADSNYNVQRQELSLEGFAGQYRYIKVKAFNYGKLPPWHQGAGGDAFIFIDEITID